MPSRMAIGRACWHSTPQRSMLPSTLRNLLVEAAVSVVLVVAVFHEEEACTGLTPCLSHQRRRRRRRRWQREAVVDQGGESLSRVSLFSLRSNNSMVFLLVCIYMPPTTDPTHIVVSIYMMSSFVFSREKTRRISWPYLLSFFWSQQVFHEYEYLIGSLGTGTDCS